MLDRVYGSSYGTEYTNSTTREGHTPQTQDSGQITTFRDIYIQWKALLVTRSWLAGSSLERHKFGARVNRVVAVRALDGCSHVKVP